MPYIWKRRRISDDAAAAIAGVLLGLVLWPLVWLMMWAVEIIRTTP